MPLHVMAAERISDAKSGLEIDLGTKRLCTLQRLRHHVEGERAVRPLRDGQANPVDGDRVADRRVKGAFDHQPTAVERSDLRALANDAGEHVGKPTQWGAAGARE